MGALSTFLPLITAGATVVAGQRQAQQSQAASQAQLQITQQQQIAQQQVIAAQQAADTDARRLQLARNLASVRARAGASGVGADATDSLAAGLVRDAVDTQAASNDVYDARMASGRASLLQPDGSLTAFLRSSRAFGTIGRSLLSQVE